MKTLKPKFDFDATIYDSGQTSFMINAYFGEQQNADDSERDAFTIAGNVITATATLFSDDVACASERTIGESAKGISFDLRAHKSIVPSAVDVVVEVFLREFTSRHVIFNGSLSVGSSPGETSGFVVGKTAGGIDVISQTIMYTLEGKKTKVLDSIYVEVFVKNISDAPCFTALGISDKDKDERSILGGCGGGFAYLSGDHGEVIPGETVKFTSYIYPRNLEEIGINKATPDVLAKLKIFPFIYVFGAPEAATHRLEKPVVDPKIF